MSDLKQLLLNLHQRPIAFYPLYAKLMGSAAGGIVLSQLLYWWAHMEGEPFYKTDVELLQETGLSAEELRTVKKRLKRCDWITVQAKGAPPKTWYTIDYALLAETISSPKLILLNQQNQNRGINEIEIVESTKSYIEHARVPETTSETTSERKKDTEGAREDLISAREDNPDDAPMAANVTAVVGCANFQDPMFPCPHETNALAVLPDILGYAPAGSHRHLHAFVHRHSLADVVLVAQRYTETTLDRTQWKLGFIFHPDTAEPLLSAAQHPPPQSPPKPQRPEDVPVRHAAYKVFSREDEQPWETAYREMLEKGDAVPYTMSAMNPTETDKE